MDHVLKSTVNLEKAVAALIEDVKSEEFGNDTLLKSKLSLSLTLINMAVKSIPRLINLFDFSLKAEEKIFSNKNLDDTINTLELMELYKLSIDRQNSNIQFIGNILNSVKWNELETALLLITAKSATKKVDSSSSDAAKNLLAEIHQLKTKGIISPEGKVETQNKV